MEDRLDRMSEQFAMSYAVLRDLLTWLPLPIQLPAFAAVSDSTEIRDAVTQAREHMGALPLSGTTYQLLNQALLAWLAALDVMTVAIGDPTDWREDSLNFLLQEFVARASIARHTLMEGESGEE